MSGPVPSLCVTSLVTVKVDCGRQEFTQRSLGQEDSECHHDEDMTTTMMMPMMTITMMTTTMMVIMIMMMIMRMTMMMMMLMMMMMIFFLRRKGSLRCNDDQHVIHEGPSGLTWESE